MDPKTISASSLEAFESCPAMYSASFILKADNITLNKAGPLGSACHAALEIWVTTGQYKQPWPTVGARRQAMAVIWESVYFDFFEDRSHYDEGREIVLNWVDRTTWEGRTVLSCEVKENFPLPTEVGTIPVTYIWDRCDRLDLPDGKWGIDVVDYKTYIQPVSSDDLKNRIQPRIYALAAAIKYRDASEIWVTYDLLRYNPISVRFTREDNIVTWNYLKAIYKRIKQSDGTDEILNPSCRYCVRKASCITLQTHHKAGGVLRSSDTLEGLIDQRHEVKSAIDGLQGLLTELDELITATAEEQEVLSFESENTTGTLSATSRRTVDTAAAARILGPEIMLRYGRIGVTDIDKLAKSGEISEEQRIALKEVTSKQFGSIRVSTKSKRNFTI